MTHNKEKNQAIEKDRNDRNFVIRHWGLKSCHKYAPFVQEGKGKLDHDVTKKNNRRYRKDSDRTSGNKNYSNQGIVILA